MVSDRDRVDHARRQRAIGKLIRLTREGHSLFITPDGPRGPRMRVNKGIVDIARLSGSHPAGGHQTSGENSSIHGIVSGADTF